MQNTNTNTKRILSFLKLGIKLSKKCHKEFWKPTKKQIIKRITSVFITVLLPRTIKYLTVTTILWVRWLKNIYCLLNCGNWGEGDGGTDWGLSILTLSSFYYVWKRDSWQFDLWKKKKRPIIVPIIPGWKDAPGSYVSCPVYHEKCERWGGAHHLDIKK